MKEYRRFGPPGTGKTTRTSEDITQAANKFGPDSILVTSFTKAGAEELVSRKLPIPKENVATAHAHCYRALGRPPIAEKGEILKQWNEGPGKKQGYQLSSGSDIDSPLDDPYGGEQDGDNMMQEYQRYRARMTPRALWRTEVKLFAKHWEAFKTETGSIDFTDMIEIALRDIKVPPGMPSVLFVDEAQDMTKLELSLMRSWRDSMEYIVLVGDDDQCIYAFKGASPDAFLDPPIDAEFKRVLTQSYRVPRRVHSLANEWVKKLARREPKEYQPRDADGDVRRAGVSFDNPEALLRDSEQYLKEGKSVMFLTACAFQLEGLKYELRARGMLFHNPYRKKRGDWNPLGAKKTAGALLDFLAAKMRRKDSDGIFDGFGLEDEEDLQPLLQARLWSKKELLSWIELTLVSTYLKRGAKAQMMALEPNALHGYDIEEFFNDPQDLIGAAFGSPTWLRSHLKPEYGKRLDYLLGVTRNAQKPEALNQTPRVIIGTIHSVKGGEADVVYLCPDLSMAGARAWSDSRTRDEIIRQFYVGATRARETLVIAQESAKSKRGCFVPI